ncbi:hypothetical protein NDU88_006405 [Pleurodeles waltl]|uniref:Uncharacterized protein n=1 Tax=Pleurodeles waltl TaxID=8319 RepID=A0AAV7VLV2_PLEWA|nr:hypothetical protein NDU88_006405 [Pleurodeles waltl]
MRTAGYHYKGGPVEIQGHSPDETRVDLFGLENAIGKRSIFHESRTWRLRRSCSALERLSFWFPGAWQDAVDERRCESEVVEAYGCARMCAPHSTTSKEFRRAAGAVRWYRAALELRRSRKNAARIPLRGNSGSASGNIRAAGAVFEKRRLGERLSEQPKEISEFDARRKTVRQSGEGGVFLAPPPPFTTVEGTAQLSQDSTVPIIEEKGGLVKKKKP